MLTVPTLAWSGRRGEWAAAANRWRPGAAKAGLCATRVCERAPKCGSKFEWWGPSATKFARSSRPIPTRETRFPLFGPTGLHAACWNSNWIHCRMCRGWKYQTKKIVTPKQINIVQLEMLILRCNYSLSSKTIYTCCFLLRRKTGDTIKGGDHTKDGS